MTMTKVYIFPLLILFVFAGFARAENGNPVSIERTLSILRGTWRYNDFHVTSTIIFESDSKLSYDSHEYFYELSPDVIRIFNNLDSADYAYTLDGDHFTWSFPDGNDKTFRRTAGGNAENHIEGDYFVYNDSSGEKISFDGDNQFHASSDSSSGMKGFYRVEGDIIIFSLPDGTSDEAEVRANDNDGFVTSMIYHGQTYDKNLPLYSGVSEQPVVYVPVYYSPPLPGPTYIPPSYPLPQGGGTTVDAGTKKDASPTKTVRDFGTTRGTKTPRQ